MLLTLIASSWRASWMEVCDAQMRGGAIALFVHKAKSHRPLYVPSVQGPGGNGAGRRRSCFSGRAHYRLSWKRGTAIRGTDWCKNTCVECHPYA